MITVYSYTTQAGHLSPVVKRLSSQATVSEAISLIQADVAHVSHVDILMPDGTHRTLPASLLVVAHPGLRLMDLPSLAAAFRNVNA